jgi:hypothetical protein
VSESRSRLLRAGKLFDTSMASPKSVVRAQSLTRTLQLALANARPVPSGREDLASHGGLLPSAMEEHDVVEDRMRRSRAPSPDEICPMKARDPGTTEHRVSPPTDLFLYYSLYRSLTRHHRRVTTKPKEPRGRVMVGFTVRTSWS